MKQTAVELLQEQLNKTLIDNQIQQTEHLFEQAKEMEKKQIIDANNFGYSAGRRDINGTAEQYYNETFKEKGL
jgi:hypothetical protein